MKLGEALTLRKHLDNKVTELRNLLADCVTVQEGNEPAEKPETLMRELDECLNQLEHCIYSINVTNMRTTDENGKTMTKLLAERDILKKRIGVLNNTFRTVTSIETTRYSRTEIKTVVTIDQKNLRSQINRLSQQYRQLDTKIQAMNFTCDLAEL